MNKNEKLKYAISGQKQENIPFSFWTHLPDIDREPEKLAEASYQLYKDYDLDFIKTMNNGMYAVEDSGTDIDFSEVAKGGVAKVVSSPVKTNQDWTTLEVLKLETASQMSSYDKLTSEQYETYGVPYDLQVLAGASAGWFNAIHLHGDNIMFDLVKEYPVQVFNWHIWETLPDIKEGLDFTSKSVMGGIARMNITHHHLNELQSQIYRSIISTQGQGLILTPGCGIRHPFEESTIRFLKKIKTETETILQNN